MNVEDAVGAVCCVQRAGAELPVRSAVSAVEGGVRVTDATADAIVDALGVPIGRASVYRGWYGRDDDQACRETVRAAIRLHDWTAPASDDRANGVSRGVGA